MPIIPDLVEVLRFIVLVGMGTASAASGIAGAYQIALWTGWPLERLCLAGLAIGIGGFISWLT